MQNEQRRRYAPREVIISKVTEDDLLSLAEGYYAAFSTAWFDNIKPKHLRPSDEAVRAQRFATRMIPWLAEPHTRFTKATLHPRSPSYDPAAPNRVIGHAGWLLPGRTTTETMNFWRKDASDMLGWRAKMGWTKAFEEELWSGTDLEAYQKGSFVPFDRTREKLMDGTGHWFLAPLWVHPDHQGRGVASLLLRDGIELADKSEAPIYLEAIPEFRGVYEHFGFQGFEGEKMAMIRNAPDKEVIS